jgi:hypothetical protein
VFSLFHGRIFVLREYDCELIRLLFLVVAVPLLQASATLKATYDRSLDASLDGVPQSYGHFQYDAENDEINHRSVESSAF